MLIYIGGSLSGCIASRCIVFFGCCGIGGGCLGGRRGACGEVGSGFALALSGLWEGGGSLWPVSKVGSSARACVRALCLPRFILLGGFSDTLLVVLILDIVYDCHLQPVLQS